MKQLLTNGLRALMVVPVLALAVSFAAVPSAPSANAVFDQGANQGAQAAQGKDQQANLFSGDNAIFRTITNVLLFLIGAVSVIMLIIGGIRYTVSGGDSTAITSAKNTILYAIVGIIVALLAYAVVNFVLSSFAKN